MLPAAYIIVAIVVLLGTCLFYFRNTSLGQRNWDSKYSEEVSILLASLEGLNTAFGRLTAFESGYLANAKCSEWCREADRIIDALSKVPRLKKALSRKQVSLIRDFKALRLSSGASRTHFNSQFLKEELKLREHYFNYLLANPLDENQRKSIVTDEDCNLIIAGAGCGKTTTIEGKVKYIIDRYGVKEDEIVLLSFTAKSAEEMRERINRRHGLNITASTFHSLGLDIIGLATGEKPSVMEERACWDIVRNAFHEKRSDNRYLTMLNEYFISYLKIPPEQESIANQDELGNYLKGNDVVSLKNIEVAYDGKKTLERQYCKSFEEVRIANFLYLNGVKYQYEPDYEHSTATAEFRQYQPDFYLVHPQKGLFSF
jgi:DNA helicase-4